MRSSRERLWIADPRRCLVEKAAAHLCGAAGFVKVEERYVPHFAGEGVSTP